eukprot:TRINITY_DN3601_c0_g1_i1.p1 TRINITY_DN3601_c0_g1~~TRINITY_DN3601_c0_g1_i1.p1  ORF type:complete len:747 (-),score=244.45 TRINITY_DN3601_c0_g1_i1:172-2412(-)
MEAQSSEHLTTGQTALLEWCQKHVNKSAPNLIIKDFGECWSDGKALVHLLHSLRPDLVDLESLLKESPSNRIETIFDIAQDKLKIDPVLEVEDFTTHSDDLPMGLPTYLLKWYILHDNTNSQIRSIPKNNPENRRNTSEAPPKPLDPNSNSSSNSNSRPATTTTQPNLLKDSNEGIKSCLLLDEHISFDNDEKKSNNDSPDPNQTNNNNTDDDDEPIQQVLADIVSEKPRLTKPTRNMGAKGRRPPSRGQSRLGARIKDVKTDTEASNKDQKPKEENLQYLLKEDDPTNANGGVDNEANNNSNEGGAGGAAPGQTGMSRRVPVGGAGPNLAQAALGVKLKKVERKEPEPKPNANMEPEPAEIPEWKQKLLARKKDASKNNEYNIHNNNNTTTHNNNNTSGNNNNNRPQLPSKENRRSNPPTATNAPLPSPRRPNSTISTRGTVLVKKEEDYLEGFLYKKDHDKKDSAKWKRRWFMVKGPHLVYYAQQLTKKNSKTLHPLGILSLEMVESVTKITEGDKTNVMKLTDRAKETYSMIAETEEEIDIWIEALSDIVAVYNQLRTMPQEEVKRQLRYASMNAHSVPNLHLGAQRGEGNKGPGQIINDKIDRSKEGVGNMVSTVATNLIGEKWSMISASSKEGMLMKLSHGWIKQKWSENYYVVMDGFLTESKSKGGKVTGRIALMGCELKEYSSGKEKFAYAFTVNSSKKQLVLAAKDLEEMHGWMNAIVKQRFHIEEAMNAVAGGLEDK